MTNMTERDYFDVIIVGGSYSGLAAAMALGRALRKVLIIDAGRPCNEQTPFSHNFLTRDGMPPHEIAETAKEQVHAYGTVEFVRGVVTAGRAVEAGFLVETDSNAMFAARKLIFATGIKDQLPPIAGLADCWGISVLHCPYCHGYEVRDRATGILGTGSSSLEFAGLIANWTADLTFLTNGDFPLSDEHLRSLEDHGIRVESRAIEWLEHRDGRLEHVVFDDGDRLALEALYVRPPFAQSSDIPESLGCDLTDEGYLRVDSAQRTSVPGVYACGDNCSSMRTVANAVASGTAAGMMVNKEMVLEAW